MKRKIITIDEEKCTGCGLCIPDCPEGALQMIDGKARLISDLFCDGLGACIGTCPEGAISVIEREAEPYDEPKVMENILKQGPNVVKAHLDHLKEHNQMDLLNQALDVLKEKRIPIKDFGYNEEKPVGQTRIPHHGGCPGSAMLDMREKASTTTSQDIQINSQLKNWPIQLQLLNPMAPYLKNADLLVSADCVPFAYGNFHQRFLKDKVMITFCPKLDQTIEQYIDKLAAIFKSCDIKSISIVHMEVPCCNGTVHIIQQALQKAQKVIPVKDYTISISGEII
jgi:NAD-dependent dihydropyrimidine dehydrogenase PreA subunit